MDKRNEYSKKAIREALIRLSRTKPYSEITVSELCREAKVSRSTFYNNYSLFNDVVAEMSEAYMEKLRGRRLTRDFFDSLKDEGDELKLLLESGVFGREFTMYLRDIVREEIIARGRCEPEDISVNVTTLYHAFGIFGALQNLLAMRGEPEIRDEGYRRGIDALMEIIRSFTDLSDILP